MLLLLRGFRRPVTCICIGRKSRTQTVDLRPGDVASLRSRRPIRALTSSRKGCPHPAKCALAVESEHLASSMSQASVRPQFHARPTGDRKPEACHKPTDRPARDRQQALRTACFAHAPPTHTRPRATRRSCFGHEPHARRPREVFVERQNRRRAGVPRRLEDEVVGERRSRQFLPRTPQALDERSLRAPRSLRWR